MESLRALPEAVEVEFGNTITVRDAAIESLTTGRVHGQSSVLGPPDLVWLQKQQQPSSLLGPWSRTGQPVGFYHTVVGRDIGSAAAVAGYFGTLAARIEPCTGLTLWPGAGGEWKLQRGIYACYDAISGLDLRCELRMPGGVSTTVVGGFTSTRGGSSSSGGVNSGSDAAAAAVGGGGAAAASAADTGGRPVDAELWAQAQASAFARARLYDAELLLAGGATAAYDWPQPGRQEATLLRCIITLYSSGRLPGRLGAIWASRAGCGVAPEDAGDPVLVACWQHFRLRQRWTAAGAFFGALAVAHAPAAALQGAAARAARSAAGAQLARLPPSLAPDGDVGRGAHSGALVLLAAGYDALEGGEPHRAAELARATLRGVPRCRPAWLLLARSLVARGQHAAALVALNVAPAPPLPAADAELLLVVPPPRPLRVTQPRLRRYDADAEAARGMALEDTSHSGDDTFHSGEDASLLASLPGAVLMPREPLGCCHEYDAGPGRLTRSVLASVYGTLQDVVDALGWDGFLELRSRVFMMQQQAAGANSATKAPHAGSSSGAASVKEAGGGFAPRSGSLSPAQASAAGRKEVAQGTETVLVTPRTHGSDSAAGSSTARGHGGGSGGRTSPRSYYTGRLAQELQGATTTLTAMGTLPAAGHPVQQVVVSGPALPLAVVSSHAEAAQPHHQPSRAGSITPALWEAVFGSSSDAREDRQTGNDNASSIVPPAGLPRIRTHPGPLAEAVERSSERPSTDAAQGGAAQSGNPLPVASGSSGGGGDVAATAAAGSQRHHGAERGCAPAGDGAATLAADRAALLCGELDDDSAAAVAGSHRLCVRYLDELILALWHDLQQRMAWRVLDQALRDAGAADSHAKLVVRAAGGGGGDAGSDSGDGVDGGGRADAPLLSPAEWARRGALAERLGASEDAAEAYRASLALAPGALTPASALLRLEAAAGRLAPALQAAAQVLSWHQQRAAALGASEAAADAPPPMSVAWALALLCEQHGSQAVMDGVAAVTAGPVVGDGLLRAARAVVLARDVMLSDLLPHPGLPSSHIV